MNIHKSVVSGLFAGMVSVALLPMFAGFAPAQEKKAPSYALTAPPLEIFDRLGDLQMGPVPKLTAE